MVGRDDAGSFVFHIILCRICYLVNWLYQLSLQVKSHQHCHENGYDGQNYHILNQERAAHVRNSLHRDSGYRIPRYVFVGVIYGSISQTEITVIVFRYERRDDGKVFAYFREDVFVNIN